MSAKAEHELSITRLIDAPPETVYRVWTERTSEWWCPKPWETPVVEHDLRAGGRSYFEMQSPEGERFPHDGVYLEVVPNERIVVTNAFKAGWIPQALDNDPCGGFATVSIFSFEPEGSGTRYTARVRHWNGEALKQHEAMGFHEGWSICAAQLAELAEEEARSRAAA
jgi:uncharacterized protein YndB with AHSA1/START domain